MEVLTERLAQMTVAQRWRVLARLAQSAPLELARAIDEVAQARHRDVPCQVLTLGYESVPPGAPEGGAPVSGAA